MGSLTDEKRSFFPDLIVHDRSGSPGDHNILVVEAKKSPSNALKIAFDRRKLEAYQRELLYQYARYVEFATAPGGSE